MLKNQKLSVKIGAGFGIILIITFLLGIISIFNMISVNGKATTLSNEYVAEVNLTSNLQGKVNDTMYNMRGYTFSMDEKYLKNAKADIVQVNQLIKSAEELSTKYPNLVKLKSGLSNLKAEILQYESLINDSKVKSDAITKERTELINTIAPEFVNNYSKYLSNQQASLQSEITNNAGTSKLEERRWKIDTIEDIIELGSEIRVTNFKAQALRKPKLVDSVMINFDEIIAKINQLEAKTAQQVNMQQLEKIRDSSIKYKSSLNDLTQNWIALENVNTERGKTGDAVLKIVNEITNAGLKNTTKLADESASALSIASVIMILGLIIAIAMGISAGLLIIRSITKPINRIVTGLSEGANQVSAASNQLSIASQKLAEANAEQAASIQETSSTLEESSSMVQQNTENTKQAALLAEQAKMAADRGNLEMQEMLTSMNEIKKSSDQISKIIKVIDEIAFQTNILALNAAVEAARAGDVGMGFAVVADEVRNLAQRSAKAASETATIIENNIELSEKGVGVAKKVGDSLQDITLQAKKVNELMDEIAAASNEQSQGIYQINKAILQMEKATHANASTAEESAAASEELSAQAETLGDIVRKLVAMVNGDKNKDIYQLNNYRTEKKTMRNSSYDISHNRENVIEKRNIKRQETVNPEDVIPLDDDTDGF